MFLDFEASTLAGWLVSYSVPEDMKPMRKEGRTGEDGVFELKVVEVVLSPTKTGYGSTRNLYKEVQGTGYERTRNCAAGEGGGGESKVSERV